MCDGVDELRQTTGEVLVVATPIGNLEDLAPRAARVLGEADVVACEDTRRTGLLLSRVGIDARLTSLHEHNERARAPALAERAAAGERVAVVTDAGTPTVSDPGLRLVREAVARGVPVRSVPGPSAPIAALAVAGLPTDRVCLEGFLPRDRAARSRRLADLADEPRTIVLLCSPHRAAADLRDLADALGGDRPAALCRELTKLHEEVRHGGLAELAEAAEAGLRGELTLVVAGRPDPGPDPGALDRAATEVASRVADGEPRRRAVDEVASREGLSRREVYEASLRR